MCIFHLFILFVFTLSQSAQTVTVYSNGIAKNNTVAGQIVLAQFVTVLALPHTKPAYCDVYTAAHFPKICNCQFISSVKLKYK